jgi:hypothetical protein
MHPTWDFVPEYTVAEDDGDDGEAGGVDLLEGEDDGIALLMDGEAHVGWMVDVTAGGEPLSIHSRLDKPGMLSEPEYWLKDELEIGIVAGVPSVDDDSVVVEKEEMVIPEGIERIEIEDGKEIVFY